MVEEMSDLIEMLKELLDDTTVPRNVKTKVQEIINILNVDEDMSLKVSKALAELEDVSNDTNMQPFTRTQIWNIVSFLETMA